jgi:serine/threonine protein kinase SCH9
MTDFTTSILNFINKQKSGTPEAMTSSQQSTSDNYSTNPDTSVTSQEQQQQSQEQLHQQQQQQQQTLMQGAQPLARVVSPSAFPSKILPHATPTIGINEKSYAMGTTIKDPNALNRSINQFDHQQQSNLTVQLNTSGNNVINSNNNNNNNNNENQHLVNGKPPTSNVQQINHQNTLNNQSQSQPQLQSQHQHYQRPQNYALTNASDTYENVQRGKLRICVVEAQGLNVSSEYSQPYAVCTFESSEIITQAPESYDPKASFFNKTGRMAGPGRDKSTTSKTSKTGGNNYNPSNPVWHHTAIFDVIGSKSQLKVSVYDAAIDGSFLGHVSIFPKTIDDSRMEQWYELQQRLPNEPVNGRIRIKLEYSNIRKRHYGPNDFEILRLLGKGTFGQVFQVKKRDSQRIYAMKVLSKQVIVKKKEIAHTIGERNILVRTATTESPFIVGLKFSFQTPTDLYLVTDFMSGGELFWHLQKEGRFSEERAKFYIAELVLALEHLHDNDIVYRDLKPENILLDANGHIALCDFGLSKANLTGDGTTSTFCGTTEYLAPEVLLDESGYTKMVDFWSLGVLIFEMCCGWSPFYAESTQQMYKNIAFGKVRFPKEVLSMEGRSFVKGLLNRNPKHRLGAINDARELREHPFFQDINWEHLKEKKLPPPFVPHIANELDTSNFDPEFTTASTSAINRQLLLGSTPLSQAVQENFKGFTYVDDSTMFDHFNPSMGRRGSYKPQYGSFIPGNPNLPPDEEVVDEQSDIEEEAEDDDMDVDYEFVNGQFDL